MYIVPILMLLFIGSLVVALICVRVRNCDFESALNLSRSTANNGIFHEFYNNFIFVTKIMLRNWLKIAGMADQSHFNSVNNHPTIV